MGNAIPETPTKHQQDLSRHGRKTGKHTQKDRIESGEYVGNKNCPSAQKMTGTLQTGRRKTRKEQKQKQQPEGNMGRRGERRLQKLPRSSNPTKTEWIVETK